MKLFGEGLFPGYQLSFILIQALFALIQIGTLL